MKSTRLFILTSLAMIAFASNSLLCRLALKQTTIDAATFTFVRIFSGAVALWLILEIRTRLRTERTASLLFDGSSGSPRVARHSSLKSGNWPSALALFVYAAAFSFAYVGLPAGTGALLLFAAVQATMILWGFHKGERLDAYPGFWTCYCTCRTRCACLSQSFRAAVDWINVDAQRGRGLGNLFGAWQS